MFLGFHDWKNLCDTFPVDLKKGESVLSTMAEEFIVAKWYPDYIAKGDCKKTKRARKYFIEGAKAVRNLLLSKIEWNLYSNT